jgi:hypothetical protein
VLGSNFFDTIRPAGAVKLRSECLGDKCQELEEGYTTKSTISVEMSRRATASSGWGRCRFV